MIERKGILQLAGAFYAGLSYLLWITSIMLLRFKWKTIILMHATQMSSFTYLLTSLQDESFPNPLDIM